MKKILLVLIIMMSVMLLGACTLSDDTAKIEELELRLEIAEAQIDEVEQILIDLEIIEGLNNQREYYLPEAHNADSLWQGVSATEYETLGTELDKSKAPSYVLDVNEEYIPFDDVAQLLVTKYYGNGVSISRSSIGIQTEIVLEVGNMSQEEFIAKTILLIEELSNYDFYIIGSTQLVIQTQFGSTAWIIIPIQTLRSSFITMTPELIINGTYEIQKTGLTYDGEQVMSLYDQYVLSGDYANYVLNFN